MRRLPVFILIDSSSSMKGEAINAVNLGLNSLLSELRTNPFAIETVFLSVITFNTKAQIARPFSDLLQADSISIEANGKSNFGLGLDLLINELKNNINKTTKDQKGDWKPLVFLMTDGRPSGAWKKKLKEFLALNIGQWIVCACGIKTNLNIIESMGGSIIILNNKNNESVLKFFKWISNSVGNYSKSIDQNQKESFQNEKFKIILDL
jgi:uncharacterized protein YegL